jgi:hypothetical protein
VEIEIKLIKLSEKFIIEKRQFKKLKNSKINKKN